MPNLTMEATIRALWEIFVTYGLLDILVSENGPQLTAKAIEVFLAEQRIRHVRFAPFSPLSNGQAERMVRLTKETLTRMGSGNWKEKIDKFVLAQRITLVQPLKEVRLSY